MPSSPKCINDNIDRHALPVIGIDKSGSDNRIAVNNERRRNWQYPSIIALIRVNIPAGVFHKRLHLQAHKNCKIERERIAIIDVG